MFGVSLSFLIIFFFVFFSAFAFFYAFFSERALRESSIRRRIKKIKSEDLTGSKITKKKEELKNKKKAALLTDLNKKDFSLFMKIFSFGMSKEAIKRKLEQSKLKISVENFYTLSFLSALFSCFIAFYLGAPLYVFLIVFFFFGFFLPQKILNFLFKRKLKKFLNDFPNAIDIIVRGVRSGLPFNDSVRLIVTESQEPVSSEFRQIVEAQNFGLSAAESTMRMRESMPCAETIFFSTVIQLQSQTGGNISEALGNLSRLLRERKKLRMKIDALSMEAKVSAWIIGCLPLLVSFALFVVNQEYIMLLFITELGNKIFLGAVLWMVLGVFVMKQMMDFEV